MIRLSLVNIKYLLFLLLIACFLLASSYVRAQTVSPNPSGSPAGSPDTAVVFPVKELGNCENKGVCLAYCVDPVNFSTCVSFAKQKKFYQPDKILGADKSFFDSVKKDLGCDSKDSCQAFCSKNENRDKCDGFAKKQGLIGGYVKQPDKPEVIDQAKKALGCDSAQGCTSFCDKPENAAKCSQFAHSAGLLGGNVKTGPGGCQSEGTCKSFCSDPNNFDKCKPFAPPNTTFQGPGGCTDLNGCRSYCEQNPDNCRSYAPGANGRYVPVSCPAGQYFGPGGACTQNGKTQEASTCAQGGKYWSGSSCQSSPPPGIDPKAGGAFFQPRPDMGGCSTPGGCYDFCKANPGKCQGFGANATRPPDTYVPTLYYTPGTTVTHEPIKELGGCTTPGGCYDFCKANPGKCQGFDSKSPRPLDTFVPGTYYTPPTETVYFTPPATNFYVTPTYYTPPPGSNYTTPSYYTPGIYSTPSYYTPPPGSNYTTPTYYTPGSYYATPQGSYPTPSYVTPNYYTPPPGSNYTTPTYYTPATYTTPTYYTPPPGSNYTTPTYHTPSAYTTPTYYTPGGGGTSYTTPVYYTPPPGSTYTSPTYYTPSVYNTPSYYTPPPGSTYTSPTYPTPSSYSYPSPGSYASPTYPTPSGSYSYPTPSGPYTTPSYSYPSPSYVTPSYGTPSYGTPSYGTPAPPPPPSYGTPSYGTPSYNTPPPPPPPPANPPPPPPPPGIVHGVSTGPSFLESLWNFLFNH